MVYINFLIKNCYHNIKVIGYIPHQYKINLNLGGIHKQFGVYFWLEIFSTKIILSSIILAISYDMVDNYSENNCCDLC